MYSKPVHSEHTTCPIAARRQTQCQTQAWPLPIVVRVTAGCLLQINGMQADSIVGGSGRDAQVNAEKTRGKEWAITAHCVNTVRPRAHARS